MNINKETATKWADTIQIIHDFLVCNMQYGDDWEEECKVLEDIIGVLADIEYDEA